MLLKKNNGITSLFFIMFLFVNTSVNAEGFSQNQIKIVYTANMSEISSDKTNGYAAVAHLLNQTRKQEVATFFFFGGGSIGPSMLSAFDRGSHIIDLLNLLEPDVMGVAKRDFSFFEDELSLRSYEAAFPFVATNVVEKNSRKDVDGLMPYVIAQQGDYRVGILSTLFENALVEYNLERIDIVDKSPVVKKQAELLRKANVDLIVLLNSGIENDVINLLEEGTVDLILQKDSNAFARGTEETPQHPQFVFLQGIDEVSLIDVSWESSIPKNINVKTDIFNYSSLAKDNKVLQMVNEYENRLANLLDEIIGITQIEMDTQRISVRRQESLFGNLLTDALKDYTHADIAIINGGTIRGATTYSATTSLSRRDIIGELPYRTSAMLLEVTGEQLVNAVEHGLSGIDAALGRFLQVSGISIKYNSDNPVGKRLISLKFQGEKIKPKSVYKVAMSDYLAKGGDGFTLFTNMRRLDYKRQGDILISDILINYIRKTGVINPQVNNRITDVAK